MRLPHHYARLCRAFPRHHGEIRLAEIADALCCSLRHARLLLSQMADQGWLTWRAGLGRGHPSRLALLADPMALERDVLHAHLARGDIEKALQTLSREGQKRLTALLPGYLGMVEGETRALRLPFYRPLHSLDPAQINRRTENHLIRQIFDGLTRYDLSLGRIVPALAHHWQADAGLRHWRFYLRPGVRFHHGRLLDGEDVRQTLLRLRDEPGPHHGLLAHLTEARLLAPLTIDLLLNRADALLPQRLAHAAASILPRDGWTLPDFGQQPIGTGAFRLAVNNERRAVLQAFEQYWKERPLLDAVEIWVVNDPAIRAKFDARVILPGEASQNRPQYQQAEPGCSYLAAHPASLSHSQRRQLADWLHPGAWQARVDDEPAFGMLPQWRHSHAPCHAAPPELPAALRLTTYQLDSHIELAEAIAVRLREAGCRVQLDVKSYPDFARMDWLDQTDLLLSGEVMGDDIDFGLYQWLFQQAGYRHCLDDTALRWLDARGQALAAEPSCAQRWQGYENCARQLVEQAWLIPLRHHRQNWDAAPEVQGVSLSQCGWMDFSRLWFSPLVELPRP
ncbi:SgrR family transcriptional regulator [Chromobacterium sp. IIBBL 290-4]|uniref:ABC transporter substrate-binding protein n=1 Tax=Chromobacterium sp. IIBBL 290-4 TaxID=2953890 RepID=UPI0020B80474|nr:SgrR family transcriptional regulator [Chromobacterium sp. IIBBL 290-4]UTH74886.1 SgrR family transcriptional regulator [Chromobacterium sp. IIBBL 290-4]